MAAFDRGSKTPAALTRPDPTSHLVRVIKADQAAALLPHNHKDRAAENKGPRKPAEVRLIATGSDYCDLELICGCGEVTRFRAWTTAGESAKAA